MPSVPDILKLKETMSALAERIALESFGVQLDYSVQSIQQVERILGAVHDDYRRSRSEDGLRGIALELALTS